MSQDSYSLKFYLIKERSTQKGIPIYCRITVNRRKSEFFTQFYSPLNKWDERAERVKGSVEINAALASIENKLNRLYSQVIALEKLPSAQDLKDSYFGKDSRKLRLLEYYDQFQAEIKELPDEYTLATNKKYATIRVHLEKYLDSISKRSIQLFDFSTKNVNEFELFLRAKAKLNINTTAKYLKQLKAVFNRAIQFEFLSSNPFIQYKFKSEKTHRTFLTRTELESLENLVTKNESLDRVKDCFLFSCYTGIRYGDLTKLTRKNISFDKNGKAWISIQMQKTGEPLRIPLLLKALGILNKHEEFSEVTGKLLPMSSNQKLNSYLKILADQIGINKVLTFHVARHTFATTVTLSNEIPLEVVSRMLGHANIRTTQIYAKVTNDYLLESIDKLDMRL